jgi:hypothetical protein
MTLNQTAMLLEFFKKKADISPLEAHNVLKIRSLSRRICDLKAQGHIISAEWKADATGQRYKRYTYKGLEQPELPFSWHPDQRPAVA